MPARKATPGPWVAVEACEGMPLPAGVPITVQRASDPYNATGKICEIVGQGDGRYSSETTAANAYLIAAAPEMLDMLRRVRDHHYCWCDRLTEVQRELLSDHGQRDFRCVRCRIDAVIAVALHQAKS